MSERVFSRRTGDDRAVTGQPWVCGTCGNHYPPAEEPPRVCVICADERQWVPPTGQRWTTLPELAAAGHAGDVREVEPGLTGIGFDTYLNDPEVALA